MSVESLSAVQRLALGYAPGGVQHALAALWSLDSALGRVLRTTTQPLIGQMRFAWWHERLSALGTGPVPAEPVLSALDAEVLPRGLASADLAALVEGWEALLDAPPLDGPMLNLFARERGERLFVLSGQLLGVVPPPAIGQGWALADLAAHWDEPTGAALAQEAARAALARGRIAGPRPLRFLARVAASQVARPLARIADPPSRWSILRAAL